MAKLLARFADCVFWTARYVERANSLARVLDVNQSYSQDAKGSRNWQSVLTLYADEARFAEFYKQASAETVIAFYTTDPRNASSIRSCLRQARENARTIRPLISIEMWSQLNALHRKVKPLKTSSVTSKNLSNFATLVKEGCQTHVGITMETFYRDEAWYFYLLGQQLERADQTTRLLDVKFAQLRAGATEMGSATDVSQWNGLLRAAAGFQAYRRRHPVTAMSPQSVAHFLLLNPMFPRSLLCAVNEASDALSALRRESGLGTGARAQKRLRAFQSALMDIDIDEIMARGMD
ncbi:alpha-E domain-containing protein, partial [Hypericibacter sp.]|uniref:alpha-E domain-containing protein n=1 Tax=Hypericibacter sp. TaxID=2705401 RepID=UPI003D6D9A3A